MPQPRILRLTWPEIGVCSAIAVARALINIQERRPPRYGFDNKGEIGIDKDFVGCVGEYAVSKVTDCRWRFLDRAEVDVGHCEVRSSPWPRLRIHEGDRDDAPFIMAHVTRDLLPEVWLLGWMLGRDGKRQEWYGECNPAKPNGRPAFWIDAEHLHPMAVLP